MIVDCFAFFNEYNLLEARLEYLSPIVDKFIIVESNSTFSGIEKPYNFLDNRSRYSLYEDKIIYLTYDKSLCDTNNLSFEEAAWKRDIYQKNYVSKILSILPRDAVILFGDLDEIPLIEQVSYISKELKNRLAEEIKNNKINVLAFGMEMFYYNFHQKHEKLWAGTVIGTNSIIMQKNPGELRELRNSLQKIEPGGYHLSYWNTPENLSYKIKSFAHQEFNKEEFTNIQAIRSAIKKGEDLFHREWVPYVKYTPEYIDKNIYNIFAKYQVEA